jgi:hypothetical protein
MNRSNSRIGEAVRSIRQAIRRNTPTAIICEPLKLCYYSIPKVGSSTVKRYLIEHGYTDRVTGSHHEIGMADIHGFPYPRIGVSEIVRRGDLLKFAVIRDPYRRIWSCYVDKILRNRENDRPLHPGFARYNRLFGLRVFDVNMNFPSFLRTIARIPDWMADGHFRSQHRFITSHKGKLMVDKLVTLENLDDEMRQLACDRSLPAWNPPNINPSKAGSIVHEWSSDEMDLVDRRYADDFRLFSYPRSDPRDGDK